VSERKVIGPASEKQAMYINATQDVVVFGGGRQTSAAYKPC
jgi:hypothetical protein